MIKYFDFEKDIQKIDDAIQKVGKREGYDYIFNVVSGPIVYALPQYEVTDQVVEELQKISDTNNE